MKRDELNDLLSTPEAAADFERVMELTAELQKINEAIEEMELLGHSFFVFLEVKSNTVQVLYKRNDGDLGLIEPQI